MAKYDPKFDYNKNGVVDIQDFSQWQAYYYAQDMRGDFNGDGKVDATDLGLFKAAYESVKEEEKSFPWAQVGIGIGIGLVVILIASKRV